MFAAYQNRSNLYRNVAIETGVTDADPHRLIAMLYDGAIESILRARGALKAGNVPMRGESIGKAIRIVEHGLRAALDLNAGEIARNLDGLYGYIGHRLLTANLRADDTMLAETQELLSTLRKGWQGIAGTPKPL